MVTERLDATQPGVIIRQQYRSSGTESSLRSRLQLSSIDGFDSGEYWCSVEVNGVEQAQITPSDVVFLRDPAFYSQLGACATTGALSKLQRKCAVAASSSISVATASAQTTTLTPEGNDASTTAPVKPLAPTGGVKPTSSLPNTPDNSGVLGATTDGMPNPTINREISATTDESTQAVHNSVNGSATENDLVGDNPTDSDANTNPNVLLELYIAIAILVIFGVIIMILVPVTICMCLKKRKFRMIEGMQ